MKGLEALNKIQHDFGQLKGQELVNCYEVIYKSLKALEIIKKNFEFGFFETDKYRVYIYSSDDDYSVVKRISEEEFNLLKAVLE